MPRATEPPYLTAELPGVGGAIKLLDEDFLVEEIPRYEASGSGTHVYLTIEKRGIGTLPAIRVIARALGKEPREIGYAGLKDAHGITRQRLSIEHVSAERVRNLSLNRIDVLSIERHSNKIKLGHLAGNRFDIKVRKTRSDPLTMAQEILNVLSQRGCPNYFGPQRFGVRGDNAEVGRAILRDDHQAAVAIILGRPKPEDHGPALRAREAFERGDLAEAAAAWPHGLATMSRMVRALIQSDGDARRAWRVVDHSLRRLYVSSVQSGLFNRVLAERVASLDQLETGDLAWKHKNGACFAVTDATTEQPRCDAFEISPSGPLFGRKMSDASGRPGRTEARILAEAELTPDQLRPRDGIKLDGARRPLRVRVDEPRIEEGVDQSGPYLRLRFSLPPGAYATNVTREICKSEAVPPSVSAS